MLRLVVASTFAVGALGAPSFGNLKVPKLNRIQRNRYAPAPPTSHSIHSKPHPTEAPEDEVRKSGGPVVDKQHLSISSIDDVISEAESLTGAVPVIGNHAILHVGGIPKDLLNDSVQFAQKWADRSTRHWMNGGGPEIYPGFHDFGGKVADKIPSPGNQLVKDEILPRIRPRHLQQIGENVQQLVQMRAAQVANNIPMISGGVVFPQVAAAVPQLDGTVLSSFDGSRVQSILSSVNGQAQRRLGAVAVPDINASLQGFSDNASSLVDVNQFSSFPNGAQYMIAEGLGKNGPKEWMPKSWTDFDGEGVQSYIAGYSPKEVIPKAMDTYGGAFYGLKNTLTSGIEQVKGFVPARYLSAHDGIWGGKGNIQLAAPDFDVYQFSSYPKNAKDVIEEGLNKYGPKEWMPKSWTDFDGEGVQSYIAGYSPKEFIPKAMGKNGGLASSVLDQVKGTAAALPKLRGLSAGGFLQGLGTAQATKKGELKWMRQNSSINSAVIDKVPTKKNDKWRLRKAKQDVDELTGMGANEALFDPPLVLTSSEASEYGTGVANREGLLNLPVIRLPGQVFENGPLNPGLGEELLEVARRPVFSQPLLNRPFGGW